MKIYTSKVEMLEATIDILRAENARLKAELEEAKVLIAQQLEREKDNLQEAISDECIESQITIRGSIWGLQYALECLTITPPTGEEADDE